jgi:hypothetical protein
LSFPSVALLKRGSEDETRPGEEEESERRRRKREDEMPSSFLRLSKLVIFRCG